MNATQSMKDPTSFDRDDASILGQLAAAQSAEPPELPRLTVAQTFITYQRIGIALETACTSYKALPDSKSVQDGSGHLTDLIRACEGIIKHAQRLQEGNR